MRKTKVAEGGPVTSATEKMVMIVRKTRGTESGTDEWVMVIRLVEQMSVN